MPPIADYAFGDGRRFQGGPTRRQTASNLVGLEGVGSHCSMSLVPKPNYLGDFHKFFIKSVIFENKRFFSPTSHFFAIQLM
jgi:hypothetical protein